MKPSKEEYEEALKTVRAYNPSRFVDIKEIRMKNQAPESDSYALPYVVSIDGFLQLVSPCGEVICHNLGVIIDDTINTHLTATCIFRVKLGLLNKNN